MYAIGLAWAWLNQQLNMEPTTNIGTTNCITAGTYSITIAVISCFRLHGGCYCTNFHRIVVNMSSVVRVRNVPDSASAPNIRSFFNGLFIPNGGVRIIGGDDGECFVMLDEVDGRLALQKDGERLNGTRLRISPSRWVQCVSHWALISALNSMSNFLCRCKPLNAENQLLKLQA